MGINGRTQKSVKNIIFSLMFQAVTLLSNFAIRTIFAKYLGAQYAGLYSLFTDVFFVLSMAELGLGTAMGYALYKPLHTNDETQIIKLMKLYRKLYGIVMLAVFGAGLLCLPFLRFIVKDIPDIKENIYIIFIFFIFRSTASYMLVYKTTLIESNQQKSIISGVGILTQIASTMIEIFVLIVIKNYYLYLAVSVCAIVAKNMIISFVANKHFPCLKEKTSEEISKEEKKGIFKNVRALAIYKVSGTMQKGLDSVIISSFLGTGIVGCLSYYRIITNNVDALFGQIFEAMKPSVGNLAVSESNEKQHDVFKKMNFIAFVVSNFICTCMFVLLNPFIELWVGKEYLLSLPIVAVMVFDVYILTMSRPYEAFRTANALFIEGRYRPVFLIIINLGLSLWLVKPWGVFGVLFATIVARTATHVWFDPWLLHKRIFKKSFFKYIISRLIYLGAFILICGTAYFICGLINLEHKWIDWILKSIVCCFVTSAGVILIFFRTKEFKHLLSIVKRFLIKRFKVCAK